MDYLLLPLREGRTEEDLHDLLLKVAEDGQDQPPLAGYPVEVAPNLRDTLAFLEGFPLEAPDSPSLWVRLYAAFSDEGDQALLVGEGLARRRADLPPGKWGESVPAPRGRASWGLIGMAVPGWVLLFDESLEYPVQEPLNERVRTAFLPLDAQDGALFGPSQDTRIVQGTLLRALFEALPDREDDESL